MHALIAGLKSIFTVIGFDYIKIMREACGAMGVAYNSGLPSIIDFQSPLMTLEGDYVVMMMQTSGFILK